MLGDALRQPGDRRTEAFGVLRDALPIAVSGDVRTFDEVGAKAALFTLDAGERQKVESAIAGLRTALDGTDDSYRAEDALERERNAQLALAKAEAGLRLALDGVLLGEVNLPHKDQQLFFGGTDGDELTMMFDFIGMQSLYLSMAREDARPLAKALRARHCDRAESAKRAARPRCWRVYGGAWQPRRWAAER